MISVPLVCALSDKVIGAIEVCNCQSATGSQLEGTVCEEALIIIAQLAAAQASLKMQRQLGCSHLSQYVHTLLRVCFRIIRSS